MKAIRLTAQENEVGFSPPWVGIVVSETMTETFGKAC